MNLFTDHLLYMPKDVSWANKNCKRLLLWRVRLITLVNKLACVWARARAIACIKMRRLGSEFMGRSSTEDVLKTFLTGVKDVDQSKILQVAFDGPSVNLLFLKNLAEYYEEKEYLPLVDIGTCSLHVIHGSLKNWSQKWNWLGTPETFKVHVATFTRCSLQKGPLWKRYWIIRQPRKVLLS